MTSVLSQGARERSTPPSWMLPEVPNHSKETSLTRQGISASKQPIRRLKHKRDRTTQLRWIKVFLRIAVQISYKWTGQKHKTISSLISNPHRLLYSTAVLFVRTQLSLVQLWIKYHRMTSFLWWRNLSKEVLENQWIRKLNVMQALSLRWRRLWRTECQHRYFPRSNRRRPIRSSS